MKHKIQKIMPNLWFNTEAEEAASFYTSIFKNSAIIQITRYGNERNEHSGAPEGKVMTVKFQLEGQEFTALNGGPKFKFNEAISLIVNCESQEEIDYYWEKLGEGGDMKAQACGWLKDQFGVSWQIVPAELGEMISSHDSEKSERVMKALLQMEKKIDLNTLKKAFEG
ncbi:MULTISPECIES: VOC family protein [unclassified Cytobacillus]|uniref:VOC family protein n=1 Tax=unclassified Cytobacillus TaxID=2675268 RepID=UPI001356E876|nr:VOC family protein [Cytobacillus sp. AMY 15.2]KAF0821127.1 3-demethylubiquinone-9 3-methyltransferase [Bacillus sp. ZZV12-4809]MCM3091073.1 VOC family protein [Cytobacillus sp. AMY 15.2]